MNDYLFLICIFSLVLFAVLPWVILNIWLNQKVFVEPEGPKDFSNSIGPFVSVLVPARNEAINIRRCVASLMEQRYQQMEVIVLDDESTDGTAEILKEMGVGERDARVRLIHGKPLPEGWVGKCWACHQLVEAARGEIFIFTDADTVHAPDCVACIVNELQKTNATLLSFWPDQEAGSWSERIVLPLGYLVLVGLFPLWFLKIMEKNPQWARWVSPSVFRLLGIANGQCLVFWRSAYWELGGHRALRDHLVEDAAFGCMVTERLTRGARLVNRDGRKWIRCRMYRSFRELWGGFSKNLRPVFEEGVVRFLLWGALISGLFLLPFGLLFVPGTPRLIGICSVVVLLGIRSWMTFRYRTSWWSVFLHPIAIILASLIALNSWRLWASKGVSWKARNYSKDKVMQIRR